MFDILSDYSSFSVSVGDALSDFTVGITDDIAAVMMEMTTAMDVIAMNLAVLSYRSGCSFIVSGMLAQYWVEVAMSMSSIRIIFRMMAIPITIAVMQRIIASVRYWSRIAAEVPPTAFLSPVSCFLVSSESHV